MARHEWLVADRRRQPEKVSPAELYARENGCLTGLQGRKK
jgi:hypothetical protein